MNPLRASALAFLAAALFAAHRDPIAATIEQDCAPWDGAAFRVSMPAASFGPEFKNATISAAIWKAPSIPATITFSFGTGRDSGVALLQRKKGDPELLSGSVTFDAVIESAPVTGQFDLVTKKGEHLAARFRATWIRRTAMCG